MDLFDYLTPDTTVLTPNRRLSATFLQWHQQQQSAAGKTCWSSLDILPLQSWIQRLWQADIDARLDSVMTPLSANQEQILWEEIIAQSSAGETLLQLSNTAELVKSAWQTLQQWQIDLTHVGLGTTEDSMIFLQWAQRFEDLCQDQHWLDSSGITRCVIEKIQTGLIIPPPHILLLGFTEITPLYTSLLQACETAGTVITHYIPPILDNIVQRIAVKDENTEILTMARWAKALWLKNPNQRIGCIFPRLESLRDQVITLFSEVFAEPGTYCLNYTRYPFNISAGKNLSTYPVIHTALKILNLPREMLPLSQLSHVLLTPFIGAAEAERMARAKYEMDLSRANATTLPLSQLLNSQSTHRFLNMAARCPELCTLWQQHRAIKFDKKRSQLPSVWVDIFMQSLTAFNWPGERSLSSHEYQVVDSWLKLLKEFSTFDLTLGKMNYQKALHYLTYLTTQKIFQPESPDAPIQILGLLEAAELPFAAIWVMGMDDVAWPPAPKPNPFIPQRLQRTLQMPHATAERELIYCQQLTTQLKRGAPQVIFSYAQLNEETELRPSPIIANLPEIHLDELELVAHIAPAHRILANKARETFQDDKAPTIVVGEKIRGGSSIFKLQAQCPFKAFAELRLHAKQIEPVVPGLRPTERGTLMHKALEIVWRELKDSETLKLSDTETLESIIQNAAEKAIIHVNATALVPVRYRALESTRIQKILQAWLDYELQRPAFKVVAQESEMQTTFANIPIVLRIDRIDELADGTKVIIDYKTGKSLQIKYWFGERPDEPQLPLYCVLDSLETIAIIFAQLHPEKMDCIGVSAVDIGMKNVKTLDRVKETNAQNWSAQLALWRATLQRLADDFSQGVAKVDPKHRVETCKHCHLPALCRINEVIT